MSCRVTVLPLWEGRKIKPRAGLLVVSTVSNSKTRWERDLSPFIIGPCELYDGYVSQNMENAWQFSKLYKVHAANIQDYPPRATPTDDYWEWANVGWSNFKAIRYPMGKGAKPICSWWDGVAFSYIAARKAIYGPLYAEAVQKTGGWRTLNDLYHHLDELILLDYDAYDHRVLGYDLKAVLECPTRKMVHAFVLMALLTGDKVLKDYLLRS
jgi:hypothetical protein